MLAKFVSVSPGNFRTADAEALSKYLGCQKGSVNYFSIINDKEANKVVVLYSKGTIYAKPHRTQNSRETLKMFVVVCFLDVRDIRGTKRDFSDS